MERRSQIGGETMQSIVLDLKKHSDKELAIINNIITHGYTKHAKDDIPLVIRLGDENSVLGNIVNGSTKAINIDATCNNKTNDIVSCDETRKLGTDSFAITDEFIGLTDIDEIASNLGVDDNKRELFTQRLYGITDISEYRNRSIKLYKLILLNYGSGYKKDLALTLSRALGYTLSKDVMIGKYALGEDDRVDIQNIGSNISKTAITIISSYYAWDILISAGYYDKVKNINEFDNKAKAILRDFVIGGFNEEDITDDDLSKRVYLLFNYITLNYVRTHKKLDIESIVKYDNDKYEAMAARISNLMVLPKDVCKDALVAGHDEKLRSALPVLNRAVDICIELIEKSSKCGSLSYDDIEQIGELIDSLMEQLIKKIEETQLKKLLKVGTMEELYKKLNGLAMMSSLASLPNPMAIGSMNPSFYRKLMGRRG